MRFTTWIGAVLTLVGVILLVVANGRGKQIAGPPSPVVQSGVIPINPTPSPEVFPVAPQRASSGPPTIFEALLGVLDTTDDNGTLDKGQRDRLRRDLSETNQVWRGLKEEMKESIVRANQRFAVKPNRDLPDLPAP